MFHVNGMVTGLGYGVKGIRSYRYDRSTVSGVRFLGYGGGFRLNGWGAYCGYW